MELEKKKLPLQSIDKTNCLTACYEKGKAYIHPVTLEKMINPSNNTCAVVPIPTGDGLFIRTKNCRMEDNKIYHVPSEIDSMLMHFYFDPYEFLIQIYNLHTFNQVINWSIDNIDLPPDTIKRVNNAAWKIFGSNLENISDLVIDFYYDIATNNWIKDFSKNIASKYSFDILSQSNKEADFNKLLIQNFLPKNFFVQIIKKYVDVYRDEWTQIDSHYKNLKNFTYKCLLKNIEFKIHNPNKDINLSKL
jgi:hypothetical protein